MVCLHIHNYLRTFITEKAYRRPNNKVQKTDALIITTKTSVLSKLSDLLDNNFSNPNRIVAFESHDIGPGGYTIKRNLTHRIYHILT